MRRISLFLAFLLTGSLLLLAGCGSSSSSKSSTAVQGADVVPASALGFIAINSDTSGTQWKQATQLLARFPQAEQSLNNSLKGSGVSLTDIEQALGKNTDVVLLGSASSLQTVLLTNPSDSSKLKSLISSGGGNVVSTSIGSWTAVSDSQSALDQLKSETSKGKLSDSSDFKDAVANLPSDALATMYLSGDELKQAASSATSNSTLSGLVGSSQVKWLGLSASTTSDGVLIQADVNAQSSIGSATSTLVNQLPSGTTLVVDFNGKALGLDKAVTKALGSQAASLAALGLTSDDISSLLGSEMAIYGTQTGLGLLIKAPNSDKVLSLIDRLAAMAGGQVRVTPITVAGVSAKKLQIGAVGIDYGVENGSLFFITDEASFPGTSKIADNPVYSAAAKELSIPSSTAGIFFVDFSKLGTLIQNVESLAQSLGSSSTTVPNLSSLQNLSALLGYISGKGDTIEVKALLTLR
jgi:hypothetical protein